MTPNEAIWVFFAMASGMGVILSLFAAGFHFFEKHAEKRVEKHKKVLEWKRQSRQRSTENSSRMRT